MDNNTDRSPVTMQQLRKVIDLAQNQTNDRVISYSLGIHEALIYAGCCLSNVSRPCSYIRMYLLMGGHWIHVGDYWPYDTVWVQTEALTDGQ